MFTRTRHASVRFRRGINGSGRGERRQCRGGIGRISNLSAGTCRTTCSSILILSARLVSRWGTNPWTPALFDVFPYCCFIQRTGFSLCTWRCQKNKKATDQISVCARTGGRTIINHWHFLFLGTIAFLLNLCYVHSMLLVWWQMGRQKEKPTEKQTKVFFPHVPAAPGSQLGTARITPKYSSPHCKMF